MWVLIRIFFSDPKVSYDCIDQWLLNNTSFPYPSQEVVKALSEESGLTMKQVKKSIFNKKRSVWFNNIRTDVRKTRICEKPQRSFIGCLQAFFK